MSYKSKRTSSHAVCANCMEDKPSNDFPKLGNRMRSYCWPCSRQLRKDFARKNPLKIKKYMKDQYENRHSKFVWSNIVGRSARKGFSVMSRAEFVAWYESEKKECSYCGIGEAAARVLFNRFLSVDRKENKIGYVAGNVCLACHRCNLVKSAFLSFDQMIAVASMFFRPKVSA